ncbi:MAG: hypothetical protein ACI4Q9_01155 [Candidatus Methanomethylophilaceae archaeon]
MVFNFLKDSKDLFGEAQELIRQKEFQKAYKKLSAAIDKGTDKADVARAMMCFIKLGESLNDAGAYTQMAEALGKVGDSFTFGLTEFDTARLKAECEAMADAVRARGISASGVDGVGDKGKRLIDAALKINTNVGNETLLVNEYFNNSTMSGTRLSLTLLAEGNECLAEATFWSDPKKAAEYQQIAYNYRRQLGESGEYNQRKIKEYTQSCTCWICGRQATGEGLHFFRMSADISPEQARKDSDEIMPSVDDEMESIYVCRACYSSISRRSDAIASEYHQRSLDEIRNLEARMRMEIARLDSRITSVSMRK